MLGKVQRQILWAAFTAENWVLVNEPGSSKQAIATRMEAAKKLAEWGLIEIGRVMDYRLTPVCPRAATRLTELGQLLCKTYPTQIRNGTRIRARQFENITGLRMGWMFPPEHGAHLRSKGA